MSVIEAVAIYFSYLTYFTKTSYAVQPSPISFVLLEELSVQPSPISFPSLVRPTNTKRDGAIVCLIT